MHAGSTTMISGSARSRRASRSDAMRNPYRRESFHGVSEIFRPLSPFVRGHARV